MISLSNDRRLRGHIAAVIRETYSADTMPREWRQGCDAACERIARHIAELIDSKSDAEKFVRECQP